MFYRYSFDVLYPTKVIIVSNLKCAYLHGRGVRFATLTYKIKNMRTVIFIDDVIYKMLCVDTFIAHFKDLLPFSRLQ